MKKINVFNLIFSICIVGVLIGSCKKNEGCPIIYCNAGIQNDETCNCDCPEGFLGNNCENFDLTKIQLLLDADYTPKDLYDGGIPLDSLYGKMYKNGLIFYLNTSEGTGMVAAQKSQLSIISSPWGCLWTNITGINNIDNCHGSITGCDQPIPIELEEGARIGDGKSNTDAIVAECIDDDIAAKLCRSIGEDWFLPSRGELNLMYVNLHKKGHGNFDPHLFHSSSEAEHDYLMWYQNFSNGEIHANTKDAPYDFRAAKAF